MTLKYFNVKNGLTAGSITLDAPTGNATVTNLAVITKANLGNVSNVSITGGSHGQILTTNGLGTLSWSSAGPNNYVVATMPYYIGAEETYYVTANKQGIFSVPLTIDGQLSIDGALVQVDGLNISINSVASFTSPLSWNSTDYVFYSCYGQSSNLTINTDTGTPIDGTQVRFRFKDNGTVRTLTWTTEGNKSFREIGVTLPTETVPNKTVYVTCVYNEHDNKWDAISVSQQS